ncbi:leucyl aminopeptidase family protein [Nocardioides sp. AX2bis]|uniref:leucyl aminopeptidase family protein n=1 Tax=Nocardioides sp. AX2bis TaxID=2653157 RepID=UPI0012F300F9|nr:leucyl aminopeptidase family protein [Nocardioides sp. AX2bis]VXB99307.1 putative cytosol aminopeptidase [Nocardioides sp. AX2bis]
MTSAALPAQHSPPQLALSERAAHLLLGAEVVAVPVLPQDADDAAGDAQEGGPILGPGAEELGEALGLDLVGVAEAAHATGRTGEVVTVPVAGGNASCPDLRLVLLVGVGAAMPTDLRRAGAALARATRGRGDVATSLAAITDDAGLEALVVGAMLGSFVFHWRSSAPEQPPVRRIVLAGLSDPDGSRPALDRAVALGGAGWRARTLATVPSNLKNPAWMAEQARGVAATAGLEVTVWDETDLARDGFGGILGVGQGSVSPPRLVRLDYAPPRAGRRTPTVALVGKGITFDSGGLSIKPAEAMSTMKRDMTGAAVVLAVMAALRDLGCPVRVVGLLACAENAVSGSSMRPGDVLRHYGGRTTEVTNTDAEGRLVLADAMAYAVAEVEPDVLVDVATLTGAAKVALGQRTGALFTDDDTLADRLLEAGAGSGEPLWRLPLHTAYADKLASGVADSDNAGAGPGAIVAALFLKRFAGSVPWAHLDVAPVGDVPTDHDEWTAGPSGFGARALLTWLGGPDPVAGVGS